MGKVIDISKKRFFDVVVIRQHGVDSTNKITWLCQCDCGKELVATGLNLKSGNTKSCGCRKHRPARFDVSGQRYGRLVAKKIHEAAGGKIYWRCVCDCGKITVVPYAHLSSGHTRSCGCLSSDVSSELAKKNLGGYGDSHPRWRHDLTAEQRRKKGIRIGIGSWAKKIISRDTFCAKCFSKESLHAHHIYGYLECEERRTDLANGIALCASCHRAFHSRYGISGFTRENVFDFIAAPDPGDFSLIGEIPKDGRADVLSLLLGINNSSDPLEDLRKARWYIDREIARLQREPSS